MPILDEEQWQHVDEGCFPYLTARGTDDVYMSNVRTLYCKSKKEGKDQESIQSSTTPYPGYQWKKNKLTIRHHKRKPRGQPFPNR